METAPNVTLPSSGHIVIGSHRLGLCVLFHALCLSSFFSLRFGFITSSNLSSNPCCSVDQSTIEEENIQYWREFLLNKKSAAFVCECYFPLFINKLLLASQIIEPTNEICPFLLPGEKKCSPLLHSHGFRSGTFLNTFFNSTVLTGLPMK